MPTGVYIRTKPAHNKGRYKWGFSSRSVEYRRRYRQGKRDIVVELKSGPCMDCGRSFPICCMDFDHVRGKKFLEISAMVSQGWSTKVLEAELLKCDLVCACCHRIREEARGHLCHLSAKLK